jgi:hypothetical protein
MTFREKAQLVTVSVVLALALAAGLYQAVKPKGPHGLSGTDDAPIIMAGGSLTIGTENFTFTIDSTNHKLLADPLLKVFQIDLFDQNDNLQKIPPVPIDAVGDVVVSYCGVYANPCTAPYDKVLIHFEKSKPIEISNTKKNIENAARVLLNLRMHRRKHWVMSHVTVNFTGLTKPVEADCGPDGECSLIIHTCQNGGDTCSAIQ